MSYLDRVIAGAAAGAAHVQLGDLETSIDDFERALTTANEAGDVVARELVGLTRSIVLPDEVHLEPGHLGAGWKLIAHALGAIVVGQPGEPVA